ncbi:molybdopterin-dependent oxidoreductase [Williamsia sp. CHRR-6]|uniref:molybdopterin-dependent oxidoreductase n=1 Tax=Williamsia sp. CHRR-6 TaxID=2835871 RepID=UPI001BD94D67|nr:molybdopterin-dependent oxidoreductase [Williamsia sp. CHRR-6]MBT0567314.1 molybdopterin-dependent oxidoreductase [Williamsia sp. CHRR-6]
MRVERTVYAAVAGVVAVGAALAAGEVVSLAISANSSPYFAVGSYLIDNAPEAVRQWAIRTFGTSDKTVLLAGMGVGIAVIAAVAGLLERRRVPIGSAMTVIFAIVGAVAATNRPTAETSYVIPSIVSGVVGVLVLRALLGFFRSTNKADPTLVDGLSRRTFISAAGSVAVVAAAVAFAGRQIAAASDAIAERRKLKLPVPKTRAEAIPAGADVKIPEATSFITKNDDFYRIDTALQVPKLKAADWELRIHGMVENELRLTWDDLMGMEPIERVITMTCVSNQVGGPLASNATWIGYPIKSILEKAKVKPGADMLFSTSVDGWTCGTPLQELTDGRDAMLAVSMNGEPLPLEHGYPVRQVVPGLYGFVSGTKWVVDWKVTTFDKDEAYWTKRGWGAKAPIKTASRIDRPAGLSQQPAGEIVIAGTAWAQRRGIAKVEVRIDNGPWEVATLADEYSIDTWRQWTYKWQATKGQHTITCRATDKTGATQTEKRTTPIPGGATGWHNRVLTIV